MYMHLMLYRCVYMYIYIYIYTLHVCIHIYIYIYMYSEKGEVLLRGVGTLYDIVLSSVKKLCLSVPICAVAACWFDSPRQQVAPMSRIPRSTSHLLLQVHYSFGDSEEYAAMCFPIFAADKIAVFRGNHLSSTTCLTPVFFKSGASYSNLWWSLDTTKDALNKPGRVRQVALDMWRHPRCRGSLRRCPCPITLAFRATQVRA